MNQITLHDLGIEDYDEILALWEVAGLPVRPEGRDAPDSFARQMAARRQRVVGLREDARLTAVVVLTHDGRKGWINRLAVVPPTGAGGLPVAWSLKRSAGLSKNRGWKSGQR